MYDLLSDVVDIAFMHGTVGFDVSDMVCLGGWPEGWQDNE